MDGSEKSNDCEVTMIERYLGCLLGGAAGDALGAAVEFMRWPEIESRWGPGGIRDYTTVHFKAGQITDDTQMTLATARGLITGAALLAEGDVPGLMASIHAEYLGWLRTQDDPLLRRAPGCTCLSALRSGTAGTVKNPINNSKGCGGVMRVAPVGLAAPGRPGEAYVIGAASAALTHGHPGGYVPAGFMAALISRLLVGEGLREAVEAELKSSEHLLDPGTERLVHAAHRLAGLGAAPYDAWHELGEGWTGDGALAIGLYSALLHSESFEEAVVAAVNHSGDSDSTGSICGSLLGCALGVRAIPARWLETLEHREELERLGREMSGLFASGAVPGARA